MSCQLFTRLTRSLVHWKRGISSGLGGAGDDLDERPGGLDVQQPTDDDPPLARARDLAAGLVGFPHEA